MFFTIKHPVEKVHTKLKINNKTKAEIDESKYFENKEFVEQLSKSMSVHLKANIIFGETI